MCGDSAQCAAVLVIYGGTRKGEEGASSSLTSDGWLAIL